jgi:hypothetical protein
VTIESCVIASNTGSTTDGVAYGGNQNSCSIINSIFYANGRDGIRIDPTNIHSALANITGNIFVNNAGYGINVVNAPTPTPTIPYWDYNAYYNNTLGAVHNLNAGAHDVTLTGSPFTNAPTDFTLNNTASAGKACRSVGTPGALPASIGTGYADIGPLRHQDPASGGTQIFQSGIIQGLGAL